MTDDQEEQHVTSEDELKKELVLIRELIKRAPQENQAFAAYNICMEAIIWGSNTVFEAVGILESVKQDYLDLGGECNGDCEHCDQEEDE
jgi:hypothetical protein